MIRRIKQEIRNYLNKKYDAEYFQELENQTLRYDEWIRQQENKQKEERTEIVWDLLQKKENAKTALLSYGDLYKGSLEQLMEALKCSLKEKEFVILAKEAAEVSEENVKQIEAVFAENNAVEIVYGDEDEINSNGKIRMNPWFKPDFSPDTLLSYFYFGNLIAVRKQSLQQALENLRIKKKELFPMKDSVEGCEDKENKLREEVSVFNKKILYALVLEMSFSLKREQIYHLKRILYSSHNIAYWGFEEEFQDIRYYYDNLRMREDYTGVSVIIPSKDNPEVLERCLKSVVHWTKDISYEIIVVDNGSNSKNREEIEKLQKIYGFLYEYVAMEFNFSKMCNIGAQKAQYELLLFLNDDCEVRGSKCLSHMAKLAAVRTNGAVGAKLYYPESKRIQHCGIYNIHLGPVHKLQFKEDVRAYYDRKNKDVRNVLAVTAACLMVRKSIFESVHGFDENLKVAFNDVDFCYRLYEAGLNNVVDNEIHLWHHESLSRGTDESPAKLKRLMEEKQKLYQKHTEIWENDPYYHEGFSTDILDTGFSFAYEYPHLKYLTVEKPEVLKALPTGVRVDECVVPMIEYAGDLQGWFLKPERVKRIEENMGTEQAVYLQGNVVILGSNNTCFLKKIVLLHEETGALYQILPQWYYRPDIFSNLQDQINVALSGFACLVDLSVVPKGKYEVGILTTDKISKQSLLRITTRSIEKQ